MPLPRRAFAGLRIIYSGKVVPMGQKFKRILSLLMVVVMSISIFIVPAFAAGEEASSDEEVESGSVMAAPGSADKQITPLQEEDAPTVSDPPQPDFSAGGNVSIPDAATGTDGQDGNGSDPEGNDDPSGEGEGDDNHEDPETFTVSYYDSDKTTLLKEETVEKDAAPTQAPSASAWLDSDGSVVSLSNLQVTENISLYAWYKPDLKVSASSHSKYVSGTGDGNFSPSASLSRAEAAVLLSQLLESADPGPYDSEFPDVSDDAWYAKSISALASYGILAGSTNGKFYPARNMKRAELVSVLVRITGATGSGNSTAFTDVPSTHWAKADIAIAAENNWISGYGQSDGTFTFRPNSPITRAEAIVVINRVLGRAIDEKSSDTAKLSSGDGIRHFLDVSESAWYYYAVMEASISHSCSHSGTQESWTGYTRETSGLPAGFNRVGSVFCYIDSDGQPKRLQAGINQIDDTYLYAPKEGYTATMDFSSGKLLYPSGKTKDLTAGIQRIKGTSYYYFYWDGAKNKPMFLSRGLHVLNGCGYLVDNDGFTIRGGMTGGTIVSLDGKNYMANDECSILTTGYAHDGEQSYLRTVDLKNKNFEYGNYMYHIKEDYSLITDDWYGYLYFGKDCRYTSGDATLDGYVWNVVSPYVNLSNQTQVQKLLLAYYKIRGGRGRYYGDSYGTSMFGYQAGGTLVRAGRYNDQHHVQIFITCAKEMYSTGYGRCFQWAAAYHYVVRRLGFQSYLVVGEVWEGRNVHCWNMIKWKDDDGYTRWHISDIELEWGHLCGYYDGGKKIYRDLFAIKLPYESVSSYKHPECSLRYYFP